MKTVFLSLALGIAVEAGLLAGLMIGGIGPCGPSSPLSGFVVLIHSPGLALASSLGVREGYSIVIVPAAYAALWTVVSWLILTMFSPKESPM